MKPLTLTGLVIVVLGIAALVVGHVSFTTQKQVAVVGPLTASVDDEHNIVFPDIASYVAIAAGLLLVGVSLRKV